MLPAMRAIPRRISGYSSHARIIAEINHVAPFGQEPVLKWNHWYLPPTESKRVGLARKGRAGRCARESPALEEGLDPVDDRCTFQHEGERPHAWLRAKDVPHVRRRSLCIVEYGEEEHAEPRGEEDAIETPQVELAKCATICRDFAAAICPVR